MQKQLAALLGHAVNTFQPYKQYVDGQLIASSTAQELSQGSLRSFCACASSVPRAQSRTLQDLLALPQRRLMQYYQLLKKFNQLLESDDPSKQPTIEALTRMSTLLSKLRSDAATPRQEMLGGGSGGVGKRKTSLDPKMSLDTVNAELEKKSKEMEELELEMEKMYEVPDAIERRYADLAKHVKELKRRAKLLQKLVREEDSVVRGGDPDALGTPGTPEIERKYRLRVKVWEQEKSTLKELEDKVERLYDVPETVERRYVEQKKIVAKLSGEVEHLRVAVAAVRAEEEKKKQQQQQQQQQKLDPYCC